MKSRPVGGRDGYWLLLEAAAAGLAYGAGLCWVSTCLLASFRPRDLSDPYWHDLPGLRTDTCGIISFVVVAVALSASEYLRLRRRRDGQITTPRISWSAAPALLARAISETVAILATGLVGYLSVNAVTHPATLAIRATHLAPWPTEGTLRVIALLLCACSIAVLRFVVGGRPARAAAG